MNCCPKSFQKGTCGGLCNNKLVFRPSYVGSPLVPTLRCMRSATALKCFVQSVPRHPACDPQMASKPARHARSLLGSNTQGDDKVHLLNAPQRCELPQHHALPGPAQPNRELFARAMPFSYYSRLCTARGAMQGGSERTWWNMKVGEIWFSSR